MLKAYKYRIYPTAAQEVLLAKHFGCVRWVYNYGLAKKTEVYQREKRGLSYFDLAEDLTGLKKAGETEWLSEVNSQSLQQSLKHLDAAFTGFFRKKSNYPRFKGKHDKQSFSCPQGCWADFEGNRVFIPKFREGIRAILHRKFEGRIKTCFVSRTKTGRYFISMLVEDGAELPEVESATNEKCLGIDLGLSHYLTTSEGEKVANPRHLKKKLKKLRRESRRLSRRKGEKNRAKQRRRVAKTHEKVANTRRDFLHKLSHSIAENQDYNCVAMETLDIQGMMKGRLARQIGDAGWFMFQTFLEYKLRERGKTLLKIGRFEPSSKLCFCGHRNDKLTLSDREWVCPVCGQKHDRDILAANNIRNFAFLEHNSQFVRKELAEFTPVETCVSGSVKQEAPML